MYKQVYFGILISSSLLGAVGLVQASHTKGLTQKIAGTIGVGGATAAMVSLGLGVAYDGKAKEIQSDFDQKLANNTELKDRELTGLKLEIAELKSRIKALESDKDSNIKQITELQEKLNNKAEEYLKVVTEKDLKIKALQDAVDAKDTRIEDFLEGCRTHTISFFSLRYNNLDAIQKALEKAEVNEEIRQSFDKRLADIWELKQDLTDAIVEIKKLNLTSFKEILDYIFEFDNKFLNVKTRWKDGKVKEFQSENKVLRTSLGNSMPKDVALERFRAGMDEVDERITEKYEALLLNNNSIHSQLLDLLEQRNLVIDDLTKQVEELQKPLQAMGTHHCAVAANRISTYYFENYGYRLDFIQWEENETGFSIIFATRKNTALTDTELMPDNTPENLAVLTGAMPGTLPKFEYNYQNCTVTLHVTLRKPIKKEQAKGDIDKIWIPVEKFESYIKNWERVRITAGSTGGKSPTAKNLALAIMKQRKGQGEIRLYDPQHGSKKDYWDMPKVGTSHKNNLEGMQEVCDLIDERRNGSNHTFILYIFDEVDNTVAELKEGAKFKDLIKVSLKEGSHANIGVIYIGQSADANEVPGMTHSNWNNAVQLHIGSNAGAAIETNKAITNEQKTKLLEQYAKIQEYCDRKNEELGLDIFTDPGAYRFALAIPLTGLPKFIQLPDFDTYNYYDVMGDGTTPTHNELISSVLNEVQEQVSNDDALGSVECPHCGSLNTVRNGKSRKGEQLYSCKDCTTKPVKWVFPNSN